MRPDSPPSGASFSNHTGVAPYKQIIQVDAERTQLARFHPIALPVWSDIARSAQRSGPMLVKATDAPDQITELAERWKMWRDEKQTRMAEDRGKGVASVAVFEALSRLAPADAIIAVDVGTTPTPSAAIREQRPACADVRLSRLDRVQLSRRRWALGRRPRTLTRSKAAKLFRCPAMAVFGQYAMEFNTAVKYGMDVTHVLLNNAELGKISKEQRAGEWPVGRPI